MNIRGQIAACFAGTLFFSASAASAQVELKNDGFMTGDSVGFQSGFVAGEIGASRFDPPAKGVSLLKVQFFFGGGANGVKRDVIVRPPSITGRRAFAYPPGWR